MKIIKYFFEFIFIGILLLIFKILGYRSASNFGAFVGGLIGPMFRSKKNISSNIKKAFPEIEEKKINLIIKNMWTNYGRILADYMSIKNFRESKLNGSLSTIITLYFFGFLSIFDCFVTFKRCKRTYRPKSRKKKGKKKNFIFMYRKPRGA